MRLPPQALSRSSAAANKLDGFADVLFPLSSQPFQDNSLSVRDPGWALLRPLGFPIRPFTTWRYTQRPRYLDRRLGLCKSGKFCNSLEKDYEGPPVTKLRSKLRCLVPLLAQLLLR